jgi:predicted MFS family arabinose efflux permease
VVSVCWAASTLVFGMLSDRIGRKRVLIPAMVAFSVLSWCSGLAQNFQQMLLVRALLGLAEGPCWSVIMALMEESSTPAHRGRNIGIVVCAGPLVGSTIGPILATQVAEHLGWRSAFFAAGIPGLILAALVAALIAEPQHARHSNAAPSAGGIRAIIRMPAMWGCFAAGALLTIWVFGFNTFAPIYLTSTLHMPATTMGFILAASGFGGFFYCLLGPALSDRIGRRPTILACAAIAVLLPVLLLVRDSSVPLAVIALLTTSGPALAALVMIVVPMELAPASLAATAVGFVSIGGDAVGATVGPVLGGYLSEQFGSAAPLEMAAAAAASIVVIAATFRETRPSVDPVIASSARDRG